VAVDSAGNVYVADTGNSMIRIGMTNTCLDQPTIDPTSGYVGQMRQLDTTPQTAAAWQWDLIRRPAASSAVLSAANVHNPTFTPDVPHLFVFRLQATNVTGAVCIRTLALTATVAPPLRILGSSLALPNRKFSFTIQSLSASAVEVQSSTDLVNWTTLVTLTNVTGTLPFTDPATNLQQRFYRLRQR
jgi:hypothetical protein